MGCSDCKQKITTAPIEENKIMENTSFKLRSQISFAQLTLANPNFKVGQISDDIIIDFLMENPNRISLFSEFPENWKELMKGPAIAEPTKEIEVELTSKDKKYRKNRTK